MKRKTPVFPTLNQREMAAFLGLPPARLEWATHEKIVKRDGLRYHPEVVTSQWLQYERAQSAKRAGESELERERVRLVRAKAEAAERKLAVMDHSLLGTDDIVETVRKVCFIIRSKFQSALPRIARGCFHAPTTAEALSKAREEFNLLTGELSALKDLGTAQFEVVKNADGVERSESRRGKSGRAR